MIEHMLETHAADGDTQLVHVRKVRKAHAARFMDLTEYHVAFRTMKSTPSPDPALQRTSHPGGEVGVTPLQFTLRAVRIGQRIVEDCAEAFKVHNPAQFLKRIAVRRQTLQMIR